eukprot:TRINITY_DN51117_c0_g1_i1.p1 TRINITY_DN51117_c0_g1~~TRINITY_DN51117_c0_g1_i1.p1  ORF type:complete len:211 (-),score=15.39 TRINITY_DN51117_c0_g1_i1:237-869(-)
MMANQSPVVGSINPSMLPQSRPPSRYGGTLAPCDDPHPCEVSDRTGFLVHTYIGPSRIPGAGLGRFVTEAVPADSVIRRQTLGAANLLAFRSEVELLTAFPLPQDALMLADFAYSCSEHVDVVLLDAPPTMVNHATSQEDQSSATAASGGGPNTVFRFSGNEKVVVATRDIVAGEELLQDYRAIARVSYLEELLAKAQLQSARQLGQHLC